MSTCRFQSLIAVLLITVILQGCAPQALVPRTAWEELRSLPFPDNYPTAETADRLHDEMLFHRSTQVVLWSLPAMTLLRTGSSAPCSS